MNKKQIIREHYSALGKKGGPAGGKARMSMLTPKQRKELAKKAAAARWGKAKAQEPKALAKRAAKGE